MSAIGVRCSESEEDSAREFFELFKTPWEFAVAGKHYPVLVTTPAGAPAADAALVVHYCAQATGFDALHGVAVELLPSGCAVRCGAHTLPIYGRLAAFHGGQERHVYRVPPPAQPGPRAGGSERLTVRVGYDLFREVAWLLQEGQPPAHALFPTLDLHIALLREWIVGAGIPLVEIPPTPWGHPFIACLTHDVDFAGIRRHKFDHTVWGFLYRATAGSLVGWFNGRVPFARVRRNWLAACTLPCVHLGLADDFWAHFDAYADVDPGAASTFFVIPFKNWAGSSVAGPHAARRATRYDVEDVREQVRNLAQRGCEIGLHGIDAWRSAESAVQEQARIKAVAFCQEMGVRMHWLCFDRNAPGLLDRAGLAYDATCGYNDAVGYRAGTAQVFRPPGAARLLELPLHIQDTALFYPRRMGLADAQAWALCAGLLGAAARSGGVLTVSWHERSLAPERQWGDFYRRLLAEIDACGAWFATAGQAAGWFRARRALTFEECRFTPGGMHLRLSGVDPGLDPPLRLRVHLPHGAGHVDLPCNGESPVELTFAPHSAPLEFPLHLPAADSAHRVPSFGN